MYIHVSIFGFNYVGTDILKKSTFTEKKLVEFFYLSQELITWYLVLTLKQKKNIVLINIIIIIWISEIKIEPVPVYGHFE